MRTFLLIISEFDSLFYIKICVIKNKKSYFHHKYELLIKICFNFNFVPDMHSKKCR